MESLFIALHPPKEISIPLIQWVNKNKLIPELTNPFFPEIPLCLCSSELKRIDLTEKIKGINPEIGFSPFNSDKKHISSQISNRKLLEIFGKMRKEFGFPGNLIYTPGYDFHVETSILPENISASSNWFLHLNYLDYQNEGEQYRWHLLEKINIHREV